MIEGGGAMMWGMGLSWLLVIFVLLLAAAALVKYLLSGRRRRNAVTERVPGPRRPGTTRQALLWLGLAVALGLKFSVALSDALAQKPPPAFSMHPAPRPLPEVRFENGQGEVMALADFRGSLVLLNVWATWCAPCRREMPTLDRLHANLGGPDFQVVALSIDRQGLPAVQKFYGEPGLRTLPIYVDETGEAQRALHVLGLPTTLLIDREGNEIGRLLGPAEWDTPEMVAFLRDYLKRTEAEPGPDRARPVRAERDSPSLAVAGLSLQ